MPPRTAGDLVSGSCDERAHPCLVELRAARIPVVGWFAHHHWFVVARIGRRDRWEVWQFARAGGTAWGHLHCNLMPAERGVGNGASWIVHLWTETAAKDLAALIEASPTTYPHRDRYLPWPGPNSNTYVQWILGDRFRLGRQAVGRSFAVQKAAANSQVRSRASSLCDADDADAGACTGPGIEK